MNELAYKTLCDLRIQAMLLDMDVDIETWSLVPKEQYSESPWLTRWIDKQDESDFDINFDIGDWDER